MAGTVTERSHMGPEMRLRRSEQTGKIHGILLGGNPAGDLPKSYDALVQEVIQTSITPLGVFTAFEANKNRNDGKFVSPVTSVLFPPEKSGINKDITTEVLIESRIKGDPRGINSVNWGVIPAESVAGLISEVALEASKEGKPLALDGETKYKTLGGRFGKPLETLGQYVMEELGLGRDEVLPFLLKDLGILPTPKNEHKEEKETAAGIVTEGSRRSAVNGAVSFHAEEPPGNGHQAGPGVTVDLIPDGGSVERNGHRDVLGATTDFVAGAPHTNGKAQNGHRPENGQRPATDAGHPGLSETASGGLPASSEAPAAEPAKAANSVKDGPTAFELLSKYVSRTSPDNRADLVDAMAQIRLGVAQAEGDPSEPLVVELDRGQFMMIAGLRIGGRPVLEVLTNAFAEVTGREGLSVQFSPEEPKGGRADVADAPPHAAAEASSNTVVPLRPRAVFPGGVDGVRRVGARAGAVIHTTAVEPGRKRQTTEQVLDAAAEVVGRLGPGRVGMRDFDPAVWFRIRKEFGGLNGLLTKLGYDPSTREVKPRNIGIQHTAAVHEGATVTDIGERRKKPTTDLEVVLDFINPPKDSNRQRPKPQVIADLALAVDKYISSLQAGEAPELSEGLQERLQDLTIAQRPALHLVEKIGRAEVQRLAEVNSKAAGIMEAAALSAPEHVETLESTADVSPGEAGSKAKLTETDILQRLSFIAAAGGGWFTTGMLSSYEVQLAQRLGGVPSARDRLGLEKPDGWTAPGKESSGTPWRGTGGRKKTNTALLDSKFRATYEAELAAGPGEFLAVPQVTIFDSGYDGDPALAAVPLQTLLAETIREVGRRKIRREDVPGAFIRDDRVGQQRVYVTDYSPYAHHGTDPQVMNVQSGPAQEIARHICAECPVLAACSAEAMQTAMTAVRNAGPDADPVQVVSDVVPGVRAGLRPSDIATAVTTNWHMTSLYIRDVAQARPLQDKIHQRLAAEQTEPGQDQFLGRPVADTMHLRLAALQNAGK